MTYEHWNTQHHKSSLARKKKKKKLNLTGYKLPSHYDFKLRCVFFLLCFFVPFQVTLFFFSVKQRLVEIGRWRLFSKQTQTGGGILIVHYLLLCFWTDEMKEKKWNKIEYGWDAEVSAGVQLVMFLPRHKAQVWWNGVRHAQQTK